MASSKRSKRSKRSKTLLAETAPLSLLQLLQLAIVNSNGTTVNYDALRRLLEGILRLLDLWELPGQQQGLSPTQPEGAQPAEAPPGLEEAAGGTQAWPQGQSSKGQEVQEHLLQKTTSSPRVPSAAADVKEMEEGDVSGVSKAVALYRNVLEEMSGMKVAQACMAEDIRTIQKALGLGSLGDAASQLPGHHGQMVPESGVARPQAQTPERQHPTVPRQRGGQHTLGAPLQRSSTLQPHPPSTPRLHKSHIQLPIQIGMTKLGDEVELVGKDGRIYKGRRPLLVDKEGTATSPEQKPASAYSQLGQAAPIIFIQPLHHRSSSVPAERNLGSLGKPTPSSKRASSCRQQD